MSTALLRVALLAMAAVATGTACDDQPTRALASGPTPVTPGVSTSTGAGMRGTVSDTAFRPLAGARVEVVGGPQAGAVTMSDARGQFAFSGPIDETSSYRASKDGYADATALLGPYCEPCNPHHWTHFALRVLAATADIGGTYEMTIAADARCSSYLPEHVRSRTYRVTIPRTADALGTSTGYVDVVATGAEFADGWNSFGAGVSGTYAAFWYESLVERISDDTFFMVGVSAGGTVAGPNPGNIVAVGDGRITLCTVPVGATVDACLRGAGVASRTMTCDATGHSIVFTRR